MMKNIRITMEDEEHSELKEIKRSNNLTWRGMLQKAKNLPKEGGMDGQTSDE